MHIYVLQKGGVIPCQSDDSKSTVALRVVPCRVTVANCTRAGQVIRMPDEFSQARAWRMLEMPTNWGVGPAPKLGSKLLEESRSSVYRYRSPVPSDPRGSVLACSVL